MSALAPGYTQVVDGRSLLSRFVLEVRLDMPAWKQALIAGCSIVTGLLISAIILIIAGVPGAQLLNELLGTVFDRQSFHAVLI